MELKSSENVSGDRRERRKLVARAKIMEAGRREFFEKGLSHATIPEISKLADVGVGTFYLHFTSKEDLFKAVIDEGFTKLEETLSQQRECFQDDNGTILSHMIETFYTFAWENRELFVTMFAVSEVGWETVKEWRQFYITKVEGHLTTWITGQEIVLPDKTIGLLARALIDSLTNSGLWWMQLLDLKPEKLPMEKPDGFGDLVKTLSAFISGGIMSVLKEMATQERRR